MVIEEISLEDFFNLHALLQNDILEYTTLEMSEELIAAKKEASSKFVSQYKNGELTSIPCGHFIHLLHPEKVVAAIESVWNV